MVQLGSDPQSTVYCFVADLHALTTVQDKKILQENIRSLIISHLACGLDASNFVFFRQSHVPAHPQLQAILNNYVSLGQMRRMHAFKDKLAKDADTSNINLGLFNYPVLMAADILLYQPDFVPVGADQKQHLEVTRDIAENFNRLTKKTVFKLPEPKIDAKLGKLIGTDGQRKMSKSLGNIIGIFEDYALIEKQIMSCYTDPKRLHATDPGTVEGNPVFTYLDLLCHDQDTLTTLKDRYRAGTVSDVEVKKTLLASHQEFFAPIRAKYQYYQDHPEEVEKILARSAALASLQANLTLAKAQAAVGLDVSWVKTPLEFDPAYPRPLADYSQFLRLEFRVGKVLAASLPDWSDRLIQQTVDFGPEIGQKTIFSALRTHFSPQDFLDQQFVYVTNLPARKMGPATSEGMILAIESFTGEIVRWSVPDSIEPGSLVG